MVKKIVQNIVQGSNGPVHILLYIIYKSPDGLRENENIDSN